MPTNQLTLAGIKPPRPRSVKGRIHDILERHPDARDDYRLVQFYYWLEYCGLEDVTVPDDFKSWYTSTITAKTILQRAQEIQRDHPHLAPTPEVAAKRRQQSHQPAHRW